MAQLHPSLTAVGRERWQVCATAGAAYMGLQMMVRRPETLSSFEPLQPLVREALSADETSHFEQCRLFLARALGGSHSSFTGQNIVGDKIGLWVLTTLLARQATVQEQATARSIGRALDIPLQAWWD